MFRKLLGVVAVFGLPTVLMAQTPKTPTAGAVHGKATHFQGDVVRPADAVRTAGDVDHNQSDGAKAEDHKDAQEGPDVDEGPNGHEGPDVDEGPDQKEGPETAEQAKGENNKEDDAKDTKPGNPVGSKHNSHIGSHKP
jgi:hypothetical protein